ncbi:hypothetical protein GLE_1607 [Lysobacter enzymogenes]|uniref:Lipoprotein n=1 Tax=Lysobacter enzymogenes TaxID=69 RepID=A0A0S2DEG7_LYSEN|nr:hypothetical protein GLE_1607 [Lysobacter enzymogenes]
MRERREPRPRKRSHAETRAASGNPAVAACAAPTAGCAGYGTDSRE